MHKIKQEEMGERIPAFDWSTTPLGPVSHWPQSLRTVVNILLSSRYAMWMAWGPELTMLYNDTYRPTLGIKHPWALGASARKVWAEIWPDIGPRIDTVLSTGKATYEEGLLLFLERSGFPEETYHTFSYSPLADDNGQISGMLCVVTEETDRLIGERRVETLRDVAAALAGANTEDEVLGRLKEVLRGNKKDLPFTLTYLYDEGGTRLVSSSGIAKDHPLAPERIAPGSDAPWPAQQILIHPASSLTSLVQNGAKTASAPQGDWDKPSGNAAIVPIRQQGQEQPAGFFVAGINPYRRYDTSYSGFVDLLSGQIAAALGNARAYELERRRAEALAEIDRAKTTFFSNVSHEFRTPLTLMLGPVEQLLAASDYDRAPEERDLLNLVQRNGLRLQKLVNTLLDFSRIEAGRMQAMFEPLDLAGYTAELASNFRAAMERAGLQFFVDCKPLPEPVYVDRDMWEKVVLNLLSNALKFTLHGTVRISLRTAGDHVELEVADTGTGIPATELPHIFERFHRVEGAQGRTIEGTGIGLALVQELVKLHSGTITATSEPGQGSSFVVSVPTGSAHLPKEKIKKQADHAPSSAPTGTFIDEAQRWVFTSNGHPASALTARALVDCPAASQSEGRILLADDNADMREYVARLLHDRFHVSPVSNGEEALAAALASPPDLILSDVMMPRMDGFGLLAELRNHPETCAIPVILLSARAGEESRVEGFGAGADDYLTKPFTARELLARVTAQLSMKRRRDAAEKMVKESKATLQSFYDSSPFLMGIAELDGQKTVVVYSNPAMDHFLGSDGVRAIDPGFPASVQQMLLEQFHPLQDEGAVVRFDYEYAGPSGIRWVNGVAAYLGLGPGGRPRFSFVAEDVTEKKRTDELMRRSNEELRRANADLEQFAYSASHDLQEPLRQVAIYSQMLERKYGSKLDPKALEYLGFCVEGAHRMEMLIRDLLAYSQAGRDSIDAGRLIDISEVLEPVMKNLSAAIVETNATFTIGALPAVRGDMVPLTHLFQNLISNALKYRSERAPHISIAATEEGSYWRFAIKDNGIGIPREFQTQIFGIFKRLHNRQEYPGTGVGLAICQKIVERLGGRIWVESEPGQGATFLFTLPRAG